MSADTEISQTVSAGQLRAFIERIERIEEEIKTANGDKSEIYKEARGCGFDVKAIRQCVAARKLDSAEREERDAIFDLYWSALNGPVHVHTPARENIEQFGAAKGVDAGSTPPREPTQEQPVETANEVPAQDSGGNEACSESEPLGKSNAARPASVDAHVNDGRLAGEVSNEVVTAGETATIPHSPAQAPHALQADKTSEAVCSSPASLAPPAGTKHTETNFSSDPLNNAPSADADQAGAIVGHPVAAVAPAAPFTNPRCQHPSTCHFAESRDACHDCLMAWSQRPKDEQKRLWAEANEAAQVAA